MEGPLSTSLQDVSHEGSVLSPSADPLLAALSTPPSPSTRPRPAEQDPLRGQQAHAAHHTAPAAPLLATKLPETSVETCSNADSREGSMHGVACMRETAATGVSISVYALPLFKEANGDIRYAYIPVRDGESAEEAPPTATASSHPSQSTAAHAAPTKGSTAQGSAAAAGSASTSKQQQQQQQQQPPPAAASTLTSALMRQVQHATSSARATWDSWGRMEKRTWLRWIHDVGQTMTEDVSPEARLARGISAHATHVTVYYPECTPQEEVHRQVASIVSSRSRSELWRMIGFMAFFPVGVVLDHTVLIAVPGPVSAGYSSYKSYIHYKGTRGSMRLQKLIQGYDKQKQGLQGGEQGTAGRQHRRQHSGQQGAPGQGLVDERPSRTHSPLGSSALFGRRDGQSAAGEGAGLRPPQPHNRGASGAGPSGGNGGLMVEGPSPDGSLHGSEKSGSVASDLPDPLGGSMHGAGAHGWKALRGGSFGGMEEEGDEGLVGALSRSAASLPPTAGVGGDTTGPSSALLTAQQQGHITGQNGSPGQDQGQVQPQLGPHQAQAQGQAQVEGQGLSYQVLPGLSELVQELKEVPGDVLPEEADRKLLALLPPQHRQEVMRHMAELRRRHLRQKQRAGGLGFGGVLKQGQEQELVDRTAA